MSQGWAFVISDNLPWPMVHVFLPAIISIYVRDIWVLLSVIYIFESVEFLVSEIPGLHYWKEQTNVDTLVSDILMGLLGFTAVTMLKVTQTDERPWYACLKPKKNTCYKKIAGPFHVLLSCASTIVIAAGALDNIDIPLVYQYYGFGAIYVLVALLFGFKEWAIFSFICIGIISGISTIVGYNVLVSIGVVFLVSGFTMVFQKTEKRAIEAKEAKTLLIF